MTSTLTYLSGRLAAGRRKAAAGLVGLAVGGVLGFGVILWSSRLNPVVINSAHELDETVFLGGQIEIIYDISRVRSCPSETSRWLWTWVEKGGARMKQFFPLPNTSTTMTGLGSDQHFIVSLPVPQGVWPGEWFYSAKTVEHCFLLPTIFEAQVIQTPEIPVHISE